MRSKAGMYLPMKYHHVVVFLYFWKLNLNFIFIFINDLLCTQDTQKVKKYKKRIQIDDVSLDLFVNSFQLTRFK